MFSHNDIFNDYKDFTFIEPTENNGNVELILKYKLYQEEDNLEYTPNYIRSEFN